MNHQAMNNHLIREGIQRARHSQKFGFTIEMGNGSKIVVTGTGLTAEKLNSAQLVLDSARVSRR